MQNTAISSEFGFSQFSQKMPVRFAPIGSEMAFSQVPAYRTLPKLLQLMYLGSLKTADMLQNVQFYF
jgi:hypothetical protein